MPYTAGMAQSLEVLDPATTTLAEIAVDLRRELALLKADVHSALTRAVTIGELLIQARGLIPRGGWTGWLGSCGLSKVAANRYVRMAANREQIAGATTIGDAMALLAGTPGPYAPGSIYSYPESVKAEARRMLTQEGLSYNAISCRLGVSQPTLVRWLDPNVAARDAQRRERQRLAREAWVADQRERKIKRAVRKAGGAIAEAYALAERMQDVLGQAHREATDTSARVALSNAGTHYRKMRDEIVSALGVS